MTVGVDDVAVDGAPAVIAEDPRRLSPQQTWCHQFALLHELNEVGVGDIVVRSRCDKVVLHHLCNVGDRVGHDCNSFPFSVHGRERARRESTGSREGDAVLREYRSEAAARTALTLGGSVQPCTHRTGEDSLRMWPAVPEEAG